MMKRKINYLIGSMLGAMLLFTVPITMTYASVEEDSTEAEEEDVSLPFEATIDDHFRGETIMTLVKKERSAAAAEWSADYLNEQIDTDTIKSLETLLIDQYTQRRLMLVHLNEADKTAALNTAQKLYQTGWFYSVEMDSEFWYEDSTEAEEEDVSLPFEATIDDHFRGETIMTLVKKERSAAAAEWSADYLNEQIDTDTIKSLETLLIDQYTQRRLMFVHLNEADKTAALNTAQKLYQTGWFYSVEMDSEFWYDEFRNGDVDCNGQTAIADAVLLARYLAEDPVEVSAQGLLNAELDGNPESLDAGDFAALLQIISGAG